MLYSVVVFEQVGQLGFRGSFMLCQSIERPSSNSTRPCRDLPAPVRTLIASSACMLPMMPVIGAITPLSEQL